MSFLTKLKIFLKSTKLFKNWYVYPLVYFKLTKKEHVIFETKTGLKIKIRVNSTDLMALTHVWMIQEYSNNDFDIHDNDVVIDVGAHIGLFALYVSQFCKNGKILCYEPIKENYDMLISNLKLNNKKNVFAFNKAVSKSNSTVRIYLNSDESGHSMFQANESYVDIDSTSLENIIIDNNLTSVDFLKLDCEGAEYEIIESLPTPKFREVKKMIIEYHLADSKPYLLKNLIDTLESNSFRIFKKRLFPDIGFLYVNR